VGSRAEADPIVGLLLSHGLRAATAADDAGCQEPQLQQHGVRVVVLPRDAATARQLLAAAAGPNSPVDDRRLQGTRRALKPPRP
jgi:hypothetical protein